MDLSLIIPVYNCENYLLKGFENLAFLYSTNIVFEIIYVNDGSTDNSLAILKTIESANANVKVITQENQGSSGARNAGINIVKGKYIQFLDSDDYLDLAKIIPLLEQAITNDLDCISYRLVKVNEFGDSLEEMSANTVPYNEIISGKAALIFGYQPSSICVFLFKTDFLNSNNLRITPKITHMDVEFTSRIMLIASKVFFVDVIAYYYLMREGSITKPLTIEKLKIFLYDEVIVSSLIKNNLSNGMDNMLLIAVEKNYNSIVWNLLWRFLINKNEVDYLFKLKCIEDMKSRGLYPIRGGLKTSFQNFIRIIFNMETLFKLILKFRN